jgi:predicted oxidoreductase
MTTPIAGNRIIDSDMAWMYWITYQPWVPHWTKEDIYVAPGGIERSKVELESLGAVRAKAILWPRGWQQRQIAKNNKKGK